LGTRREGWMDRGHEIDEFGGAAAPEKGALVCEGPQDGDMASVRSARQARNALAVDVSLGLGLAVGACAAAVDCVRRGPTSEASRLRWRTCRDTCGT
jgi:hypothetical protein